MGKGKMKSFVALILAFAMILSSAISAAPVRAEEDTASLERYLTPMPLIYEVNDGKWVLNEGTKFYVQGQTDEETKELAKVADYLAAKFRASTGYALEVVEGTTTEGQHIVMRTSAEVEALGQEGYKIDVTTNGVEVTTYTAEGAFRAIQTLRQLLPAAIEKSEVVEDVEWAMPCTHIEDKPEYGYRGMMLDVARHFFTVDQVKRQLDNAAQYKINKLHMHLSDDQGWRLEIKGTIGEGDEEESLSNLTGLGASTSCTANGERPGFYTQEDFKEIVRYAQERYIEIIPEFDMPGHAWAALVSMEYLNSTEDGKPHAGNYDNTKPYQGWDVGWASLECNNPHTYEFLEEVIKQVSAISPSKYFHIGGDEAHSTSSEDYSKIMNTVADIAKKYGKTPIGWQHFDNVTNDKEGTVTQFWSTGSAKMNEGVKYVASPADYAYIDMQYPNDSSGLGLYWAAKISPQRAYSWDPTNYGSKDQIIGIEAPLWAETLSSDDAWDHMIYPRLAGHAEIGWTPKEKRSWDEYKVRLIHQAERWENQGIKFYKDEEIWETPYVPLNAEWELDEGDGLTITDKSGENVGTIKGGVKWTEGVHGSALEFDGTGYVDLGHKDLKGNWTATMWVNRQTAPGDSTNTVLLSGVEGEIKLEQWKNTHKVGITKFGVDDYSFNYSAPVGEWVHLAFVSDGTGTSLYVNGEFVQKLNVTIKGPATRIGANAKSDLADTGNMTGALDEVRIFERVLTADEIKDLANVKVSDEVTAPAAFGPVPSDRQLEYSKEERAAFIHFGVNTFTDKEWGDGTENPSIFNPTELDPDQWVKVLSETGFKKVIITAKHHDGFCLFDAPGTDHDITNEAINENIRGRDVVKEVSEACQKYGLKFGVYLSPWDQNSPNYGDDRGSDYNEYFMTQLTHLLTNYGEVSEVWFDGAKGSNVSQTYYFDQWFALVKELQPNALIFSDMGSDVRWIGNEGGYAGEPNWSKIKGDTLTLPHYDTDYLNHGDPEGTDWIMGEANTSIRPGWFFHASQKTKSLDQLVDIYFNSVGRNATLLLNVPPDKQGLLNSDDEARLREFNSVIANTFKENLADQCQVSATSYRGQRQNVDTYSPLNVTDGDYDTYWTTDDGTFTGSLTVDLESETVFDVISLQEYIPLGQRIERFNVEVYNENLGEWKQVAEGQTIGYKRLIRLAPMSASKIRINITSSQNIPLINDVSVYKADSRMELESNVPTGLRVIDDQNTGTGLNQIQFEGDWQDRKTQEGFYNNSSHWTNTPGAKATLRFKGSKFYILSATCPNHGTFNMKIDDQETIVVDNYGIEDFLEQQIVYESEDLGYGEHTVELVLSGNNPHGGGYAAHIDAFYVLDNEKGMVEIAEEDVSVDENAGVVYIPIRRVGEANGEVSVSFSLESGTALQDKDFQRMIEDVTFADGQKEAVASVKLFDNDEKDGMKTFTVRINKVVGAITGFNTRCEVHIMDDETPLNLAYQKPVTVSSIEDNLAQFNPQNVVDGNVEDTRWSSNYTDPEWLMIDLEKEHVIDTVNIYWEDARPQKFSILVSEDGENFTEAVVVDGVEPGLNEYHFDAVNARYVKIQGISRATRFGYSIYEVEIYAAKEVDKEDLKALIDYAKGQQQEAGYKYLVPAVKTLFEKALADAKTIWEKPNATQAEVDAAYDVLLAKVHLLDFTGNTQSLKVLVDAAQAKYQQEEMYTKESWEPFARAFEAAKELLKDENALQAEIDAAHEALQAAMEALVLKPIDTKKLEKLIADSKQYEDNINKYTSDSAKAFTAALEGARAVLTGDKLTQEAVDSAYTTLRNAVFGLREIPNKDKLGELLGKVKAMDLSVYSEATASAVKAAYAKATAVFEDENADQKKVDAAVAALEEAVAAANAEAGDVTKEENTSKKEDDSAKGDKVASDNAGSKGTANKTAAKTGDSANAAIPMTAGLVAILAAVIVWRKKTNRV